MQITSSHDTFSYEGTSILVNGRTSNYIKKDAETRRKGAKTRWYSLKVIFISAIGLPETVFSEARLTALSYYPCRLCFLCNSRFHINEESSEMGNTMQVRHYVTRSDTLWLPMYAPLSYSGYRRSVIRSLYVTTTKAQGMYFKAYSHMTYRAHAVPLPCRAAKGLECVFPI